MVDVDVKGDLEQLVSDTLQERFWTVTSERRRGLDLDLDVSFQGQDGQILLRNPHGMPERGAALHTDPYVLRIDLGEPSGPAEQWQLWEQDVTVSVQNSSITYTFSYQAAIAMNWSTVIASVADSVSKRGWSKSDVFYHAENLRPSRDEKERRQHLTACSVAPAEPKRTVEKAFAIVLVFALSVIIVSVIISQFLSDRSPQGVVAIIGALALLVVLAVQLLRSSRQKAARCLDGWQDVADSLRSAGLFDRVTKHPAAQLLKIPVVHTAPFGPDSAYAPVMTQRFEASCSHHGLTGDIVIYRVQWPDKTHASCRAIPTRWMTVNLHGTAQELKALSVGPREERVSRSVNWTLTGEQVDSGQLVELFENAARQLRTAAGSPYR